VIIKRSQQNVDGFLSLSQSLSKEIKISLLSKLGYKPIKIKNLEVDKNINCKDISIVIPVKNNQLGINMFLNKFFKVTDKIYYPKEIIIIDNNSSPKIMINSNSYPINIQLLICKKIGPAAARNKGILKSLGKWILFLDSDCIPTKTTILAYLKNHNKNIAYAGNIHATSNNIFSKYYITQEILIPPEAVDNNKKRPDYLVTANCLVYKNALEEIGGFDEKFYQAGGEDIDIAFRLLSIGDIQYEFNSIVLHDFNNNLISFIERFIRYGKGNKQLECKYNLNLKPSLFLPLKINFINIVLALLQYISLLIGYKKYHCLTKSKVRENNPQ
jgi:glycosyltransferase involved in cell wall biosynthesis